MPERITGDPPLLPIIECVSATDADREAACQGKLQWPSERVGTNAAYVYAWKNGLKAPPDSWALYLCPRCACLHLTTHARPAAVRKARAAADAAGSPTVAVPSP